MKKYSFTHFFLLKTINSHLRKPTIAGYISTKYATQINPKKSCLTNDYSSRKDVENTCVHHKFGQNPPFLRPSPVPYPIFIPYLYYIYPICNRITKVKL